MTEKSQLSYEHIEVDGVDINSAALHALSAASLTLRV